MIFPNNIIYIFELIFLSEYYILFPFICAMLYLIYQCLPVYINACPMHPEVVRVSFVVIFIVFVFTVTQLNALANYILSYSSLTTIYVFILI